MIPLFDNGMPKKQSNKAGPSQSFAFRSTPISMPAKARPPKKIGFQLREKRAAYGR